MIKHNIQELWELIQNSKHCVILTGAGISTLSGIPDFRGVGGLYQRKDIDANRLFDVHAFKADPSYYYKHSKDFLYAKAAKPNIVHEVLAKLENMGHIKAVVTQNVDILHQKAGSKEVFELHGSPMVHTCLSCNNEYDFNSVLSKLEKQEVPHCSDCHGVLKPNIVFFGESLPIHAISMAEMHASKADLLIILGTSLTVFPAADIPHMALADGAKIAIINADKTYIDPHACYKADDLGEVFEGLNELINSSN